MNTGGLRKATESARGGGTGRAAHNFAFSKDSKTGRHSSGSLETGLISHIGRSVMLKRIKRFQKNQKNQTWEESNAGVLNHLPGFELLKGF